MTKLTAMVVAILFCLLATAQPTNVGIGTTNPKAALHVQGNGIVAFGSADASTTVPDTNDVPMLWWYPGRAAFRAGMGGNTAWYKSKIGPYSAAFGRNTSASGYFSFAVGYASSAIGLYGVALGEESTAFGTASFSVGSKNLAYGSNSAALGNATKANGANAFSMGHLSEASGATSFAIGRNTKANGGMSFAAGNESEANGIYSTAFGNYTIVRSNAGFVVGRFNDPIIASPETNSGVPANTPLFIVGNGVSEQTRSNALVVRSNGRVGIGTNSPVHALEVNGRIRQTVNSSNVSITAGSSGIVDWSHNLGYQPVIMISLDQTGGGYMDYITHSYQHLSNNALRIFLNNRHATQAATGKVNWIVVH